MHEQLLWESCKSWTNYTPSRPSIRSSILLNANLKFINFFKRLQTRQAAWYILNSSCDQIFISDTYQLKEFKKINKSKFIVSPGWWKTWYLIKVLLMMKLIPGSPSPHIRRGFSSGKISWVFGSSIRFQNQ